MANIVTTSKAIRFSKGSVAKIALAKAEEITTSPGVRVYGPYASVQIYLSDTIDGQSFATTKAMREYIDANFFYSGGGTGAGVQSVTGDGVGGTPDNPVLSYPTPEDIGAIAEGDVKASDINSGYPNDAFARVVILQGGEFVNQTYPVMMGSTTPQSVVLRNTVGAIKTANPVDNLDAVNLQTMLSAISSVYKYKGSVADFDSLPSTSNTTGDVWNTLDTDMNFAWTGTEWDPLATSVDLTNYYTKTESDGLLDGKIDVGGVLPSDLGLSGSGALPYRTGSNVWAEFFANQNTINNTLAQRYTNGRLRVGNAVENADAVNLGQLNSVVQVTGNKTLPLTENLSFQNVTAASTITIPTNASVAFPIGAEITVALESGTATIAAASGVTTVSLNNNLTLDTVGQVAVLKKTGTDKWFVEINGGS